MKIIATVSALVLLSASSQAFVAPSNGRKLCSSSIFAETSTMAAASLKESDSTSAPSSDMSPEFTAALTKTLETLKNSVDDDKLLNPLNHFVTEYFAANHKASLTGQEIATPEATAKRILQVIQLGMRYGMGPNQYTFGVTHEALRGKETMEDDTMDYYEFGCDFFRPVMNLDKSKILGKENIEKAFEQLKNGENVVFFANHQSEADPQVFSVLLEEIGFGKEASEVVYIAGHKVTTDPLAIPFSMGRNLLCIHSKKHIDADPETKPIKQRQNMATMSAMLGKLKADEGVALWVAPSGGRDRRDTDSDTVPIAPFDSKTIDMFRLMGTKSKKPTHYYPLSMVSYELCPPPDHVEAGVGEQRNVRFVPIGIACGAEVESVGGLEKRHLFCEQAQAECESGYKALLEQMKE